MKRSIAARAIASTLIFAVTYTPLLGCFNGTVAAAQTVQNTTYSYLHDANGNLTQVTDPLGQVSNLTYDALNRVTQQLQPALVSGGARPTVSYAYDGLDQLSTVTDPRSLVTTYTNDGLGNQTSLVSPDTGTTGRTYDEAGNLLTSTDARGIVTTYIYDVLNRVTKITYPSDGPTTFEYDTGTNGIGHLTKMTDFSGYTTYQYDPFGRLLVKAQTTVSGTNAAHLTNTYAYGESGNTTGKLVSMTYPSGNRIDYTYDEAGRINRLTLTAPGSAAPVPLLSGITYAPFGAAQSWTWGNDGAPVPNAYARTFDLDGRVTSYPLGNAANGGLIRTVNYDASSHLTSMVHTTASTAVAAPTFDQSFTYDTLDRLTGFTNSTSAQAYSYDVSGNRTSARYGATSYAYTVNATNNRLTSTAGPSPGETNSFDAAGNQTSNAATTFVYYDRGRPVNVTRAGVVAAYNYNGLGQRVIKNTSVVPTGKNFYAYGEDGQLLGEYDINGVALEETVYLEGMPVAVLQPQATAGTSVYYVYADQINAPRVITSAATNAIVWRWDMADPFGAGSPNTNPSGAGVFTYNPRMPGQLFDIESNLFYNYYRTYDPQTGRYVQSDPIGLGGGINTYGYVLGNPLSSDDMFGLAPGDRYKTIDAAGIQAIRDINGKSIRENTEYAGRIYRNKNGSYSYTAPQRGKEAESDFGSCPAGTKNSGQYHTHAADSKGRFYDYAFSNSDMTWSENESVPSYLGTPNGNILKYTPIPGAPHAAGPAVIIGGGAK